MRTTEEIKKEITDAILADDTLCTAFGLNSGEEWDSQVSSVSLLNLLAYVFAMASRTLEWLFDMFRKEVEERIEAALPGTVSWYWNKIVQFQYGHDLNENASYDTVDEDAQIIKHCAVFEIDNGIIVKVNKGDTYDTLTATELEALQEYVDRVKFAGTRAYCYSFEPDEVTLELNIWRDPLVLDASMNRISDGAAVIQNAVREYLDGIVYGGVLNKTKLIDAIQRVEGVTDVTIEESGSSIYCPGNTSTNAFSGFVQNFRSYGGHFLIDDISYNDMIVE